MKKRIIITITAIALLGTVGAMSGCSMQGDDVPVTAAATQTPQKNTLNEAGLLSAFTAEAGSDYIHFLPADYDGDGALEAFGITAGSDMGGELYSDVTIWFIDCEGNCTIAVADTYGLLKESITVPNGSFITWCQTASGSGSSDLVLGCKNGELFEPRVSGKYSSFGGKSMSYTFSDDDDFAKLNCDYLAYHDYFSDYDGHIWEPIAYGYDTATREFVQVGYEEGGSFVRPDSEGSDTFAIVANSRYIYQSSKGIYVDGTLIDSKADWNFISDGYTLYYTYNNNVYRVDLDTLSKETVMQNTDAFLEGCYDNKYLYFTSYQYSDDEIEAALVVYDLESGAILNTVNCVGGIAVGDDYVFAIDQTGDLSAVGIRQMDLDGGNCRDIIDNAYPSAITAVEDELYYGAMTDYNGISYKLQIQSYNAKSGTASVLTDAYKDAYITKLTATYATLSDMSGQEYDVIYGN